MNTVITTYRDTYTGSIIKGITDDDFIVESVVNSLDRNNTFFPNIVEVKKDVVQSAKTDKHGKKIYDENGKKVKIPQERMTVKFADGTWVEVKRNSADTDDDGTALLYAIAKRLFGKPTDGGYVTGEGFMNKIKKIVDNIVTTESLEKEKKERIKNKEEEDKKAHEEAQSRKEKNPSLGIRLRNLEDRFNAFMDKFGNK